MVNGHQLSASVIQAMSWERLPTVVGLVCQDLMRGRMQIARSAAV